VLLDVVKARTGTGVDMVATSVHIQLKPETSTQPYNFHYDDLTSSCFVL